MQVVVNDLLINYQRSGKGKAIVVLHGWGDSVTGMRSFQAALAKQFDVIVPDMPGFGGSQLPKVAWGLNDYVTFVAALLKKLDVKTVYCLVGHSNGGAIAIRGLAGGQLSAERLVLLSSAGIRGTYKGRVKAIRYITKLGKALSYPLPSNTKRRLRSKVYQTVGSDMLVAEQLQETFKKVVTDDVRSDAAKLSLPALIIYNKNDQQTPLSYGEIFHKLIKGSTLKILPGSDHFVHLEQPREVVQSIQEFLT